MEDKEVAIKILDQMNSHGIFQAEYIFNLFDQMGSDLALRANLTVYNSHEIIEIVGENGFLNLTDKEGGYLIGYETARELALFLAPLEKITPMPKHPGEIFVVCYRALGGTKEMVNPPRKGIDFDTARA